MMATQFESKKDNGSLSGIFYKDGLLDLFIGIGLALAGAWMFTERVWMMGVYPAIMLPVWQETRKKTLARLGVQETRARMVYESRTRAVLLGMAIAGMVTLLLDKRPLRGIVDHRDPLSGQTARILVDIQVSITIQIGDRRGMVDRMEREVGHFELASLPVPQTWRTAVIE